MVLAVELFDLRRFDQEKFPYDVEHAIWSPSADARPLLYGIDADIRAGLQALAGNAECMKVVARQIFRLSASRRLHLICAPNASHTFWPNPPARLLIPPHSIVALNGCGGVRPRAARAGRAFVDFPFISGPEGATLDLAESVCYEGISILRTSIDNTWAMNTAIELLLLVKNASFSRDITTTALIKSAFVNCWIVNSPFVLKYIPEFLTFVQSHVTVTPYGPTAEYRERLLLLLARQAPPLPALDFDQLFLISERKFMRPFRRDLALDTFFGDEREILTIPCPQAWTNLFPEFLGLPFAPNAPHLITVDKVLLDPNRITVSPISWLKVLERLLRHHTTIVGFPFWQILSFWLQICGYLRETAQYFQPTIERLPPSEFSVENLNQFPVAIKLRSTVRFPQGGLIFVAPTREYGGDTTYVTMATFTNPISLPTGKLFFSIMGFDSAAAVTVDLPEPPAVQASGGSAQLPGPAFRDRFLREMEDFAIRWNDDDTDSLLSHLPLAHLSRPSFAAVQRIAHSSPLSSRFPPSVVVLRALFLHHVNFIYTRGQVNQQDAIWVSLRSSLSPEVLANALLTRFAAQVGSPPDLVIDRHSAARLVLDGRGDFKHSIISQVTAYFNRGVAAYRCRENKLWHVTFKNEQALDAGGPARELLAETAASIFQRTSQLFALAPDERHFVPLGNARIEYWGIGVFIALLIRCRLPQNLPFAPFIWKFIAGEQITDNDITDVDPHLRDVFRQPTGWTVRMWDGSVRRIIGHFDGAVAREEVPLYIAKCVEMRIDAIRPSLKQMRKGFEANTGLKQDPLLRGSLLSRLAQGKASLSVEDLRQISDITEDFPAGHQDPHIQRFWRTVARFTDEQRMLLLKFMTGTTRIPYSSGSTQFRLKIAHEHRGNPDTNFPRSSTCFNKLYLPHYSTDEIAYNKILYAVQNCATMEET
jgi:hypothetical protein